MTANTSEHDAGQVESEPSPELIKKAIERLQRCLAIRQWYINFLKGIACIAFVIPMAILLAVSMLPSGDKHIDSYYEQVDMNKRASASSEYNWLFNEMMRNKKEVLDSTASSSTPASREIDSAFKELHQKTMAWANGPITKIMALFGLLIAASSLVSQNYVGAVFGIGVAMSLVYMPQVLEEVIGIESERATSLASVPESYQQRVANVLIMRRAIEEGDYGMAYQAISANVIDGAVDNIDYLSICISSGEMAEQAGVSMPSKVKGLVDKCGEIKQSIIEYIGVIVALFGLFFWYVDARARRISEALESCVPSDKLRYYLVVDKFKRSA